MPAIVVSARVRAGVSYEVFDHTSLVKTLRIARPDEDTLQKLASALGDWRADSLRAQVDVEGAAVPPDPHVLTDFSTAGAFVPAAATRAARTPGLAIDRGARPRRDDARLISSPAGGLRRVLGTT